MDELKKIALKEFQKIPSIGKACALDLWNIGIRKSEELKRRSPKELYESLNAITGIRHDICMLYTFRCAVYFITEKNHNPEKLNWWYWKEHTYID